MFESIHSEETRKFHDVEQNSEFWHSLRAGKFTASSIKNLLGKPTNKGYQDEIKRVAIEILSNEPVETSFFGNSYTERGHELEGIAIQEYEDITFFNTLPGGFCEFAEYTGASPDRLIDGKNAGVEVKCPGYSKFLEYLYSESFTQEGEKSLLEKEFETQCQCQIYVCGFDFVDLVCYYPEYKIIKKRIVPDPVFQEEIEAAVEVAKEEVKKLIDYLKQHRKDYKGEK